MLKIFFIPLSFLLLTQIAFGLTVSVKEINATLPFPIERCYIADIKVCSDEPTNVSFSLEEAENEDWLVLTPAGTIPVNLCADVIFTIEPSTSKPSEFNATAIIKSDTEEFRIPVLVRLGDISSLLTNRVEVKVLDEDGNPIEGANVTLSSPYGPYIVTLVTKKNGEAVVDKFLKEFYIEVRKEGYRPYFDYIKGSSVEVRLKPHEVSKFKYEKIAEYDTGFSVWWVKASADGKYIVTSPGMHPGAANPVDKAYVMFFNSNGVLLWKYEINTSSYTNIDYCWGLDISEDGEYIAVGCYNGYVYLFNRSGELLNKYYAGGNVREVKFTDDGKYLIFGPANNAAEFGIFEVPSFKEKCRGYIGDWARKIAISGNNISVAASNGMIGLYDFNCSLKWYGSNSGMVPFVGGFNSKGDKLLTGGKGMKVIMYDINGSTLWERRVDHVAIIGELVGNAAAFATLGGSVFIFHENGTFKMKMHREFVSHNGLYMTRNGKYLALGGIHPMVVDKEGNILWDMYVKDIDRGGFEGVNTVYLSENADLLVLGYSNGKLEFWKKSGSVWIYDLNSNGIIEVSEVDKLIDHYKSDGCVDDLELLEAIQYWLDGKMEDLALIMVIREWL